MRKFYCLHLSSTCKRALLLLLLSVPCSTGLQALAEPLPDLIDRIRPSIVGVGTVEATRHPPNQLRGTGFVVGNGHQVITNAHVLPDELDDKRKEHLAVFVGRGKTAKIRRARILRQDDLHDLALLEFEGAALPALEFADSNQVREGLDIAFTGFPIGTVLGLFPVTHIGIVSVITPIAIPASASKELSSSQLKFLRSPYQVFQLDATAYPGNSGSPVYDRNTGKVIAVVNQVFVKQRKENVLKDPSAITYAIPSNFAKALIEIHSSNVSR